MALGGEFPAESIEAVRSRWPDFVRDVRRRDWRLGVLLVDRSPVRVDRQAGVIVVDVKGGTTDAALLRRTERHLSRGAKSTLGIAYRLVPARVDQAAAAPAMIESGTRTDPVFAAIAKPVEVAADTPVQDSLADEPGITSESTYLDQGTTVSTPGGSALPRWTYVVFIVVVLVGIAALGIAVENGTLESLQVSEATRTAWLVAAVLVGVFVVTIATAIWAFRYLQVVRLLDDVAASASRVVTAGLNEVVGKLSSDAPVVAPVSGAESALYIVDVQQYVPPHEEFPGSWTTFKTVTRSTPAFVRDESGAVRIDFTGARVRGERAEAVFEAGAHPPDLVQAASTVMEALEDMPIRLRERFLPLDVDLYVLGYGRLDNLTGEVYVGAYPEVTIPTDDTRVRPGRLLTRESAMPFYVSVEGERHARNIQRRQAVWALLASLGVAIAGAVALWALTARPGTSALPILIWLLAVGGFAIAHLHNALVRLRHRALSAWANLETWIQRRHDLIPGLIDLARQYARYEHEIQRRLGKLRANINHVRIESEPDHIADDITSKQRDDATLAQASDLIISLTETAPEIKADTAWHALFQGLTDTENKITHARHLYNVTAAQYNSRRDSIPERLLAPIIGPHLDYWSDRPETADLGDETTTPTESPRPDALKPPKSNENPAR